MSVPSVPHSIPLPACFIRLRQHAWGTKGRHAGKSLRITLFLLFHLSVFQGLPPYQDARSREFYTCNRLVMSSRTGCYRYPAKEKSSQVDQRHDSKVMNGKVLCSKRQARNEPPRNTRQATSTQNYMRLSKNFQDSTSIIIFVIIIRYFGQGSVQS